ncbi:CotO family spore coat protein [Bacillus sp. B6(2022)]|nr:CotO family spore coat protein [Bacillus sp. B6(2022)]
MYIVQPSYDESAPAMQNIVRKRKKSEKPSETKKAPKRMQSKRACKNLYHRK